MGFAIYLTARYKALPCDMSYGRERGDLYHIANEHSEFISHLPAGKYIALQSNISQKRRRNFRRLLVYSVGTGVLDCPFNFNTIELSSLPR